MYRGHLSALAVAITVVAALGSAAPAGAKLKVSTACFAAAGPDGKLYSISGRRFTARKPRRATPAIVLVHGVGSNDDIWDLTPRWSVARRLARAGYVVIAYDRLGYRRSRYTGRGGGDALTVGAQQAVLHDVIGQIHRGRYTVGGSCRHSARTTYASKRVAIIGHSAGGFIVSSYPGKYHDVVTMVQANAPSGLSSTSPPGNAALVSATAPPARGSMDEKYGFIGDAWTDGHARPAPPGYSDQGLATRTACEDFDLWRPGAVKDVATVLCDPANSTPTPSGETASFVDQAGRNTALIEQTGSVPVLLADADHDGIMPDNANALELSGWRENCRCQVSQFVLKDTGHAFMAHTSLTRWTSKVVTWLRRNHIG
jgi:pimeloyl-ACP methyl ester carboxylesterase